MPVNPNMQPMKMHPNAPPGISWPAVVIKKEPGLAEPVRPNLDSHFPQQEQQQVNNQLSWLSENLQHQSIFNLQPQQHAQQLRPSTHDRPPSNPQFATPAPPFPGAISIKREPADFSRPSSQGTSGPLGSLAALTAQVTASQTLTSPTYLPTSQPASYPPTAVVAPAPPPPIKLERMSPGSGPFSCMQPGAPQTSPSSQQQLSSMALHGNRSDCRYPGTNTMGSLNMYAQITGAQQHAANRNEFFREMDNLQSAQAAAAAAAHQSTSPLPPFRNTGGGNPLKNLAMMTKASPPSFVTPQAHPATVQIKQEPVDPVVGTSAVATSVQRGQAHVVTSELFVAPAPGLPRGPAPGGPFPPPAGTVSPAALQQLSHPHTQLSPHHQQQQQLHLQLQQQQLQQQQLQQQQLQHQQLQQQQQQLQQQLQQLDSRRLRRPSSAERRQY